jgi:Tol biopolymer transport system component
MKRSLDPNAEELRLPGEDPFDWSRDGKWLSFSTGASRGIWITPLAPDGKPFPYLVTRFGEHTARFSPDSRWLAYTSNETGRDEVFVRPFTGGPAPVEGKIQISTNGGDFPVWRRDGAELYFMTANSDIVAVDTRGLGRSRTVPRPSRVFHPCEGARVQSLPLTGASYNPPYDTLDGQRFLVACQSEARAKVTVLLNWPFGGKR